MSTSYTWPPTVTGRARPSPGICWRPSNLKSRSGGWCFTRSPNRRSGPPPKIPAIWTPTSSTPRRPAASWTGCTATRSARCCGRRSAGACRPGGCSPWRPASSFSASASGWPSVARPTGTSWPSWTPACQIRTPPRQGSPPGWSLSTASGWRRAGTSTRWGCCAKPTRCWCSTRPPPVRSRPGCRAPH